MLTRPDHPKLAILNCEMDGLRGADLCRRMRAESIDHYIYVILLIEKSAGGRSAGSFRARR